MTRRRHTVQFLMLCTLVVLPLYCQCSLADDATNFNAYGLAFVPGRTEQERWAWVSSNLRLLMSIKREQAYRKLDISTEWLKKLYKGNVWSFLISDAPSQDAFVKRFYALNVVFEGDSVKSLEISVLDRPVGLIKSQRK